MIARDKIVGFYYSKRFIWILVGFGVCLRLIQFLLNRALHGDEAVLVHSILNRSYGGLVGSLDYHQCAPIGFLIVEKFFTNILGTSEYSLRLWSLICGIAAMAVFPVVARRVLTAGAVRLATFLFSVSCYVIFYSSSVKQYSSDVLIALILWYNVFYIIDRKPTLLNLFVFAVVGAVVVWFCHPAVFMLAGIGLCMFFWLWRSKAWSGLVSFVAVVGIWAASFLLSYFLVLSRYEAPDGLWLHWARGFMPFPPRSISDLYWFVTSLKGIIHIVIFPYYVSACRVLANIFRQ